MRTGLTGERFSVEYRLSGDEQTAFRSARGVCIEQTVEFPEELLPPGPVRDDIVGRVESFEPDGSGAWRARISYAVETAGGELTQLLNVVFGNSSIKPGIRVVGVDLPGTILRSFRGPRYGRRGLRKRLKVEGRPLLCTALKPMGSSPARLAELAYLFALGGIDIIKDDHGLADQSFSPFAERVDLCARAVEKANRQTGGDAVYVPNVTAPCPAALERARFAAGAGAGGVLVSPGLCGFDTMRMIADDDRTALPVIAHPAFLGSYVLSPDNGIAHGVLFGQVVRLAGGDASIYPNFGGRFSFSVEECRDIVRGTEQPMSGVQDIFPCPGGGMSLDRIPELADVYGTEVVFLVGGGLFSRGPDLLENCRYFRSCVENIGR